MAKEYLREVISKFKTGQTTEHSFRGCLEDFITRALRGKISVINEPRRQECGAPDYVIQKGSTPVGYIEAKDINVNLDSIEDSDQLKRYKKSLENLVLTNYLEFRFFVNGKKTETLTIAKIENNKIIADEKQYDRFINLIRNFCNFNPGQMIKTPVQLADVMAEKAVMIRDCMRNILKNDKNGALANQKEAFKKVLLHDLNDNTFTDMYVQTIAYGLFAARLNQNGGDFSRQKARELVSKSNPFLRQLFDYIAGINLDEGLAWIVDDLAEFSGILIWKNFYTHILKSTKLTRFCIFTKLFFKNMIRLRKRNGAFIILPHRL